MTSRSPHITRRALLAALLAVGSSALVTEAEASRKRRRRGRRSHREYRDDDDDDEHEEDYQRAWKALAKGKIKPLSEILQEVKKVIPGDLIEVEFEYQARRPIYELTILSKNGIYYEFKIDAITGATLKMKKK